jgi:hypothetical protein
MQALFIGQTYIDVTFLTDRMPTGDEKHVASAYAVSFGGNAVTAAFCCAKLAGHDQAGGDPDRQAARGDRLRRRDPIRRRQRLAPRHRPAAKLGLEVSGVVRI